MHRPDIGFVAGMEVIAIILRLNMSSPDTFRCLCSLIYNSEILHAYFTLDIKKVSFAITQLNRYMMAL